MAASKEPNATPLALKHAAGEGAATIETKLGRREEIVIGRGAECDVVIKDTKASRKHCRLLRQQDAFLLEDLGSKNGTYVEGKKITGQVPLHSQQTFKIGDTIFFLSR